MTETHEEPACARSETPARRRLHFACLVLVLLLGAGLRFHDLTATALTVDEVSTLAIVTGHVFRDIPQRGTVDAGELAGRCSGPAAGLPTVVSNVLRQWPEELTPPFYYCLLTPWCQVAGVSVFVVRLFSLVAGVVCILLLYLVGSRLTGRWSGLAAASLLAVVPLHVRYSQTGRCYTVMVLCALAGTWWTLRRSLPGLVVASLSGGLCHACYGAAWLQQVVAFPLLSARRRLHFVGATLLVVGCIGAVALVMAAPPHDRRDHAEGAGAAPSLLDRMSHVPGQPGEAGQNLLNLLRIGPSEWDPVSLPCMSLLAAAGIWWIRRRGTRDAQVMMAAAGVPLALFILLDASGLTRFGSVPRTVLALTPFLYVLVTAPPRLASLVLCVALLLPVAFPQAYSWREGNSLEEVARVVASEAPPGDRIVICGTSSQVVGLCYYLPPSTPVTMNCFRKSTAPPEKVQQRWREVAEGTVGHRVWVLLGVPFSQSHSEPCTRAFAPTHHLRLSRSHGLFQLLLFEPASPTSSPRVPSSEFRVPVTPYGIRTGEFRKVSPEFGGPERRDTSRNSTQGIP